MKKQSQITRSDRGFTLVELIIVIAVIGLLAAILIPVFSNVVYKANAKSALSDARNSVENYLTYALEDPSLPRNLVIIVEKANKFYVYGYNTNVGGSLMISTGNAFTAQSKQDLIDRYSWNSLRTEDYDPNVDEATLASYDIEHYGAFYLVPYSGGEAQNANVRGITRSADDFRCVSDELAQNGANMAIYHGCIVGNNYTYNTDGTNDNTNSGSGSGSSGGNNNETPATHTVSFNFTGIEEADKANVVLKKGSEVLTNPASIPDGTYVNELTAEYPHNESTDEYWYTVGTATADSPVIHGDITVTFNFTRVNVYTLNFVMGSGETFVPASGASATMRLRAGDDIASIVRDSSATTETAGQTFRYWTEQGSAENFAPGTGALTMPGRNVTLVPYFSLQSISVTYKAGDHATGNDYNDSVTYGTHALPSFNDIATTAGWNKDANYDFYRWYDGSNEYQAGANYTFTSTTTLTARYTELNYTVTVNQPAGVTAVTGGGTYNLSVNSVNFSVTLNSNYYLTGYSVSGLTGTTTLPADATSIDTTAAQPGDDIRITPNVAAKTVNVTFVSDPAGKGTLPANITGYEIKDGDITLTAPTDVAAHYTFTSYTASGTNITASITNSNTKLHLENPTANTSSVTVTAHFTEDAKFSIIYSKNTDDTVNDMPSTQENLYAGEHNLSSVTPARDGYTFLGWGATNNATTYITSVTITDNSVTVYAIWEQNAQGGGSIPDGYVAYYGGAYRHADKTLDWNATKIPEVSGNRPLNIIDSLAIDTPLLNPLQGTSVQRTFELTEQVSVIDGVNYVKCTETTDWEAVKALNSAIVIVEETAGATVTGSVSLRDMLLDTNRSKTTSANPTFDKHYILIGDINFTSAFNYSSTSSMYFSGRFDGMGYTLNNFTNGSNTTSLFDVVSREMGYAGVQNFNMTNVNYSCANSKFYAGMIGSLSGSKASRYVIARNLHISGTMNGPSDTPGMTYIGIAGLIGGCSAMDTSGTYTPIQLVENCSSTVNIQLYRNANTSNQDNQLAAGLIRTVSNGYTVRNCWYKGTMDTNVRYVGGLVSSTIGTNTFIGCHTEGFITGRKTVGGLFGRTQGECTLRNCYSTANVSAVNTNTNSGVSNLSGGDEAGGLCGYGGFGSGTIIMQGCYFKGNVFSDNGYAGGLCGNSSSYLQMSDCWVAGTIATNSSGNPTSTTGTPGLIGGLTGSSSTISVSGSVKRCIVYANIASKGTAGLCAFGKITATTADENKCFRLGNVIKTSSISYNKTTGAVTGVSGNDYSTIVDSSYSVGTKVASVAALQSSISSMWTDTSAWNLTGTYPVLVDNPGSPA